MQSLESAFDTVMQFVPKLIAFLLILVIGWFVSKWIGKLIGKLLGKAGLDKVGDKSGLRRFTGRFELSEVFGKLIYYMLLLFTLQLAFGAFGPNPVSNLLTSLVGWLPQLFVGILLVVVAFAIANAVHGMVAGMLSETSYGKSVARIAQVAIVFIGVVAATSQAGIADSVTQPLMWMVFAAVAGVVIVGVGGGLITPMRERWERMLNSAENETSKMKSSTRQSPSDPMGRGYTSERYGSDSDVQTGTARAPESSRAAGTDAPGATETPHRGSRLDRPTEEP